MSDDKESRCQASIHDHRGKLWGYTWNVWSTHPDRSMSLAIEAWDTFQNAAWRDRLAASGFPMPGNEVQSALEDGSWEEP